MIVASQPLLDPGCFRACFPSLSRCTHLASCSLGARHVGLDRAMAEMLDEMQAGAAAWQAYEARIAAVREAAALLLRTSPARIALMPNVSIGAFQVASTLSLRERPRIVCSEEEFPSVSHVWLAQQPRGACVVHLPPGADPGTADSWIEAIDERTALVSVPLVSYQRGAVLPVAAIAARAHEVGAQVFVDASQAAGVLPVDAGALGCDFLVTATSKYLLGLPGLAFLHAREPVPGDQQPSLTGWMGRVDPFAFDQRTLDFPRAARRFETGTHAVPAVYAAHAALQALLACDAATVHGHVTALAGDAARRLGELGESVATPPAGKGPMVALLDEDAPALAAWLGERDIRVSPRGNAVRLAFHYYNDGSDVEAVCCAITEYRRTHRTRRRQRAAGTPWPAPSRRPQ